MTASQRNKGNREERRVVNWIKSITGWSARRVPLSGAAEGFKGDVHIESPTGHRFVIECKVRHSGFKQIYKWLGLRSWESRSSQKSRKYLTTVDILTIRGDNQPGIVIMTEAVFEEFAEHWRGGE